MVNNYKKALKKARKKYYSYGKKLDFSYAKLLGQYSIFYKVYKKTGKNSAKTFEAWQKYSKFLDYYNEGVNKDHSFKKVYDKAFKAYIKNKKKNK